MTDSRASESADGREIVLTRFTKAGGPLTKQISLAADGRLLKDGSACTMCRGTAERVRVAGVAALGVLIEDLAECQALALGTLRAELPDKVKVVTKKMMVNGAARPDIIARTGANIVHHGPAFALLDFDTKAMPVSVKVELERRGGFWPSLLTVLPALAAVSRLIRSSTSAGLSRADTGAALPGSDGIHVYLTVQDGADSVRFLRALHDRCWLAGFGWMMVSSSGALLDRSIVDRMVGQPERLVFEGGPVLLPPLQQDKESRRPVAVEGTVLDTLAACPPLSIVERSRLDELKARERERLASEKAKARAAFVEQQTRKKVAARMSPRPPRQSIIQQCDGILRPDIELPFDDPALAGCTVGDVLADPERFEGETLADPLEGVEYGPCKARIMRRSDGTPWIHSFRAWPDRLRTQVRRRRRSQGDGAGSEGRRGGDLYPARRRCRHRRGRTHGVEAAGQAAVRRRAASDQRHAQGGAEAACRAAGSGRAGAACRRCAGSAAANPRAASRATRGCRRWVC